MKSLLFSIHLLVLLTASAQQKIDLLVYNATVYTVDNTFSKAEAFAINKGRIIEVGKTNNLLAKYNAADQLDAKDKFVYPGFIDAHAHFFSYGLGLQTADLVGSKSWDEVLARLSSFAPLNKDGWLIGRGWDQNLWPGKDYPSNQKLNELFPDRPILLTRVDGHAAIANKKALDLAAVTAGMKIAGGEIEIKNGELSGILVDNAVELVSAKIPKPSLDQVKSALLKAQHNCFAVGLTTVDDCGLSYRQVLTMAGFQKSRDLKMRIYAMLSDEKENYDFLFATGKIKSDRLNVRAFKVYADGALGSRGACLLEPYTDRKGWTGFLRSSPEHFDSVAKVLALHGFQMCTHAIGDSGNRLMLKIYAKYLKGPNDLRWRIEHAQVINKNDFHLFGDYNIIPSVQPTHATSDMYWAQERLGDRVKTAYAYKELEKQNRWIPLGTDFPVEDISPIKTFYAAVVRKDAKGWPGKGFQVENALSREEAIRGMTTWAAKANFEEGEKGIIEAGKFADFIILDRDLMKVAPIDILSTTVLMTYINGEKVYEKN